MQFNNFCIQTSNCMQRDFICSSIANFFNESIILKIHRWRIELCDNENFECGENDRNRGRGRTHPNNLNFLFSIRLQCYWIYSHFLIEYKSFERINNIENLSMTHWVIIMIKNLGATKAKTRDFNANLIEIFFFRKRIFLLIESLTKQLRTLSNSQNSNFRYFTIK